MYPKVYNKVPSQNISILGSVRQEYNIVFLQKHSVEKSSRLNVKEREQIVFEGKSSQSRLVLLGLFLCCLWVGWFPRRDGASRIRIVSLVSIYY